MSDSDPQRYRRLLLRSMALPAILALALAVLLVWQVSALLEAQRVAARSDAVLADAVRVRQLLVDRETGVRGFLLTGEPSFLAPYHAAGERLPIVLDRLEGRVQDTPEQRARVEGLRERWRDWESVASEELRRHARGGDWLVLVRAGEGKRRMDGLRQVLDALVGSERERAEVRAREAGRQARLTLWGSAAWMLMLGAVLAWLGRRQLVTLAGEYEALLERARLQADALRASEARLEARVAQRTQELTLANRELESFSYSVSHDLRAPLRAVDGFSLALQEDEGPRLSEEGHEHLRRLRAAAVRMGQLIDDLLRLSRISRTELRHAPVDLSALANEVAGALTRAEPGRDTAFDIAPGMTALGDARLLRVVLENLLGNAWKFTSQRSGGRIVFFAPREVDCSRYCVRDNGVGFDMAYAGKLFTPFQRLHRAGEFPGTGIGLATVQRIIHRHGGVISAEAVPGEGATFCFTLGASLP